MEKSESVCGGKNKSGKSLGYLRIGMIPDARTQHAEMCACVCVRRVRSGSHHVSLWVKFIDVRPLRAGPPNTRTHTLILFNLAQKLTICRLLFVATAWIRSGVIFFHHEQLKIDVSFVLQETDRRNNGLI